jgi:nucleotide-binding universal stress UspA family protein
VIDIIQNRIISQYLQCVNLSKKTMKKILIPTGFSSCAQAAQKYALTLAKKGDTEILYLHVFQSPVYWEELPEENQKLYAETLT